MLQMETVVMAALTTGKNKDLDEDACHSHETKTCAKDKQIKATGVITFIIVLVVVGSMSIVLCHKQHKLKTEMAEMRTEIELLKGDICNILMKETSDEDESKEESAYLEYEADDMFEEEPEETLIPSAHARLKRESNLTASTEGPNKKRHKNKKKHKNGNAGNQGGKSKKRRKNKKNAGNAVEAIHIIPKSYDEHRKDMVSSQGEFTPPPPFTCILY